MAPVTVPDGLSAEVAAVWAELAPTRRRKARSGRARRVAFGVLCRLVVAERQLAVSPVAAGPDQRGILQRMEAGLARFRLTPDGKPVEQVDVQDEWSQFDVIQGGKSA